MMVVWLLLLLNDDGVRKVLTVMMELCAGRNSTEPTTRAIVHTEGGPEKRANRKRKSLPGALREI